MENLKCNWRSTIVGTVILLLAVARIVARPESLFDASTPLIFATGCGLILGTDKLLGFTL